MNPEAHLEFKDLAVDSLSSNGGGVVDSLNEEASRNGILIFATIKQRNIG